VLQQLARSCVTKEELSAEPPLALEMRIAVDLAEIDRVNARFNEFADAHDVDTGVRRAANLVFDEILNNAISYGFEDPDHGVIEIRVELRSRRICLTISDNGKPYDPLARREPDTTLDIDRRDVGGLGIHLIRNVMDALSYERRDGRNILALEKSLPPPPSSAGQGAA
jgi:anti-sigma regulatory factor (Ser/Thr protein kinase)